MPARSSDDYRDPDPGSDDPGQVAATQGTATTSVTWRRVGDAIIGCSIWAVGGIHLSGAGEP
jgi:hypothetical protein